MSNQTEEKFKLFPPTEYTGHRIVAHFIPGEKPHKPTKEYSGPVCVTEFPQSIVVKYNGRTECLPADQWSKVREGDQLTLETETERHARKPFRLDIHLTP